jgi:thiol-disulfide isomerase/thioredoxin
VLIRPIDAPDDIMTLPTSPRAVCLLFVLAASVLPFAAAPAAPPAAKPPLQALDGPGLKKTIAAQRGKVVVLNLWATWCPPCVEEFPSLVKLHNAYRGRGLVVIGVSMDEPGDRGRVAEFIRRQKVGFPVYTRQAGDLEAFIAPVDRRWSGALPTTYLFDRKGALVGTPAIGARSYEQFAAMVEPLLK